MISFIERKHRLYKFEVRKLFNINKRIKCYTTPTILRIVKAINGACFDSEHFFLL